jgi:DNA-binding GntR family transcriptional regulator
MKATVVEEPNASAGREDSDLAALAETYRSGRHRTVAEDAYSILHTAICTGKLAPGMRLPIRDLAAAIGTSPMPVREALARLDADGLVDTLPHRGASVAKLTIKDVAQIYEARLALEPLAVYLSAQKFTAADKKKAKSALDRLARGMEGDDEGVTWAAHTDFHFALYEPSQSDWLLRLIRPVWESSERYRLASPAKRSIKGRGQEHRRILKACAENDAVLAAGELHNHLVRTANAVHQSMGGGSDLFEPLGDPASYQPPMTAAH